MAKPSVRRGPYALGPRIQELDAIVRRQQGEIEGLRTTLSLATSGGGWWHEGDISLKLAKLLRVMRLKHVRPHSPLEHLAQAISRARGRPLSGAGTRVLGAEQRGSERTGSQPARRPDPAPEPERSLPGLEASH